MKKPKNFPEEMLDFAHSYITSALILLNKYIKPSPFPFFTIMDFKKGVVLSSHFLMCHGVELYLKFLIKLLGIDPSTKEHNLNNLLISANQLWKKHYKRKIFNAKEVQIIDKLNRNLKFRYPLDVKLKVIPDIFKEAEKWNPPKVKKLMEQWNQIREKLNDCGYRYTKLKKIHI